MQELQLAARNALHGRRWRWHEGRDSELATGHQPAGTEALAQTSSHHLFSVTVVHHCCAARGAVPRWSDGDSEVDNVSAAAMLHAIDERPFGESEVGDAASLGDIAQPVPVQKPSSVPIVSKSMLQMMQAPI